MSSGEHVSHLRSLLESQLPQVSDLGGAISYVRDGASPGIRVHSGSAWSSLGQSLSFITTGGSTLRTAADRAADYVNVLDFGVTRNGVDSTAAMQALAASLSPGMCPIFPYGTYKFTDTITIDKDYVRLIALGRGSSNINIDFQPTAINKPCFLFTKGGATPAVMIGSGCSGFTFSSSANVQAGKVAIKYEVLEEGVFDDIRVANWTGNDTAANPCIGIHSYGWQINLHNRIWLKAELPIRCSVNPSQAPAPGLDLDHCVFHDLYLQPATTKPCILFDDGLFVSNTHFSGQQAWVGGTQGLLWADTASSSVGKSYGLTFDGVRRENGDDATAYCFDITSTNNGLQNLHIANTNLNSNQRGIRLTSASNACALVLDQVQFSPNTTETINYVGISGQTLSLRACSFTAGATAVLTGFKQVYSSGLMVNTAPLPPTADYIFDSTALRSHMKLSNVYHLAFSGTLGDDATLDLQVGTTIGYTVANVFASVHGATQDEGMVCVASGPTNVFKIAGTAKTAVADTDVNLCVYRSAGTIFLKNRLGESVSYVVSIDGTP